MLLKLLTLFIFFLCASADAALGDGDVFPVGTPIKVQAQEDLYVEAYNAVASDPVCPKETNIPGLVPLIRHQFVSVASRFNEVDGEICNVGAKDDLRALWKQCCDRSQKYPVSLSFLRDTAFYLVHIMDGHLNKEPSCFEKQPGFISGKAHFMDYSWCGWQDRLKGNVFPTFITSKSGGFSYDRFVRGYLQHPYMLLHHPLTYGGCATVHGGIYEGSAVDFLDHDEAHNHQTVDSLQQQDKALRMEHPHLSGYWGVMRDVYRAMYNTKGLLKEKNITAIFLHLHEFIQIFDPKILHLAPVDQSPPERLLWTKSEGIIRCLKDECYQPVVHPDFLIEKSFRAHVVGFVHNSHNKFKIIFRVDTRKSQSSQANPLFYAEAFLTEKETEGHGLLISQYFDPHHQCFMNPNVGLNGQDIMTKNLNGFYDIAAQFLRTMYVLSEEDAQFNYNSAIKDEAGALERLPQGSFMGFGDTDGLPVYQKCELYTGAMIQFMSDTFEDNRFLFHK